MPTLLMTRPAPQSEAFVAEVKAAVECRFDTIISPLLRIVPTASAIPNARHYIFTSANGVRCAGASALPATAWCVGDHTARVAEDLGYDVRNAGRDAQALVEMVAAEGLQDPIVHLRGEHTTGDIAEQLTRSGVPASEAIIYRQDAATLVPDAMRALSAADPVTVPLFSPRTAQIFARQVLSPFNLHLIAISQNAADPLKTLRPRSLSVVQAPTRAAMLTATVERLMSFD